MQRLYNMIFFKYYGSKFPTFNTNNTHIYVIAPYYGTITWLVGEIMLHVPKDIEEFYREKLSQNVPKQKH